MKPFRLFIPVLGALIALAVTALIAQTPQPEPEIPEPPVERSTSRAQGPRAARSDRVAFAPFGDVVLKASESAKHVVVLFGRARVEGEVDENVVTVFGPSAVTGPTGGNVVTVFGKVNVDGETRGNVVSVFGGVELGPRARIHGKVVSVGGPVVRDLQARVDGSVQEYGRGLRFGDSRGAGAWFVHAFLLGRPLAWHPDLGWAWVVAGVFLAGYLLIALLFNQGVVRCAETFEQRPAQTIGATLLLLLLVPPVFALLVITVVGPVVLVAALMVFGLFGKAAFLAWLGRRFTLPLGVRHSVPAMLIGAALLTLGYLVPFAGFGLLLFTSALGLGMAFYTLMVCLKQERVVAPSAAATVKTGSSGVGTAAALVAVPPVSLESPPPIAPIPPPVSTPSGSQSVLPRAGFRIRLAASLIDGVVIGVVTGVFSLGSLFVPALALYCVIMWAKKGTTIGGIVCGLKLVRVDDRPLDWTIAAVRALGGFLSFTAAGLGFLWVIFDDERQSWHDKIAGTTIVHVPKGTSLI